MNAFIYGSYNFLKINQFKPYEGNLRGCRATSEYHTIKTGLYLFLVCGRFLNHAKTFLCYVILKIANLLLFVRTAVQAKSFYYVDNGLSIIKSKVYQIISVHTGKSLSEALIFASTNP